MEVKADYKQTEAGIIPEDWDAVCLESITPQQRKNGIVDGPFGSNLKTIHYRKSGIPIITSGFVTEGVFHAESYDYVDRSKFLEERRSSVRPGDIVMAKIGERCGASAILPHNHEVGILSGNALKITVDESRYSTAYVWQVLWKMHVSGELECLRTVGAQPALSMANLKKHRIPMPPTKDEQCVIAKTLNDMDGLLGELDRLIAKKQAIKQGAMQELLTGKRRLPGFNKEWKTSALSKIAEFMRGQGLSKADLSDSASYKCIHYGQLFTTYKELITEIISRTNNNEGCFYSRNNDVLMPTSDVTPNGLATASCVKEDGVILGGGILIIRLHDGYDGLFLSYYIAQNKDAVLKLVKGSTVFHLYANDLAKLEICLPDFKEQIAITKLLTDMEIEIEQLGKKLAKYRLIKQGMMRSLLTGKVRLV